MMELLAGTDIQFSSSLAAFWLALLIGAAVLLALLAIARRAPEFLPRAVFLLLVAMLLAHPVLRQDERQSLPDKVVIVVDESQSQKIAGRDQTAAAALAHIEAELAKLGPAVEPVIIRVPQYSDVRSGESTQLLSMLRDSLMTLPLAQIAGTILITDGQVHDAPLDQNTLGPLARLAPIHVVLTGRKDEQDRKVSITQAPQYGLIGKTVDIDVRVDVQGGAVDELVTVALWQDGRETGSRDVAAGEVSRFTVDIDHPGQNVFEFRVPVAAGEMTDINNTAPVIINGVRDRLRVLLVSGVPHMGERAWRNLLKSDPGIDLIHFTILRPPTALDATPQNELSLIVFPVDELFDAKIDEFDLIIFDKYHNYNLLQPLYFANIRAHVRNGGAFLLAMGSDQADASIFETALRDTLPVTLGGASILSGAYTPTLTPTGARHPITGDLARRGQWGAWLTQADINAHRGQVLMTGQNDAPLLVIDEVEKGRVAVIASDNLWLWSKGGAAAGPYSDLLRNLGHWLMKEPELEEDYLKAEVRGRVITISQRDAGTGPRVVTMKTPAGETREMTLSASQGGWVTHAETVAENGIYSFVSGDRTAFAVVGTAQSPEYADVLTSEDKLSPTVQATRGGIVWFNEEPAMTLRHVDKDARQLAGSNWLGLRRMEAYSVTAVKAAPVFTNPLFLLTVLLGLLLVWLLESGRRWRR